MGIINFKGQLRVALDETAPVNGRRWALRSCCDVVASLTGVIATDDVIQMLACKADADVAAVGGRDGKRLITSRLTQSSLLLVRLRTALQMKRREYDEARRHLKRSNRRFPVAAWALSKEEVVRLLGDP